MSKQSKYPEFKQLDLPAIEKEVLDRWDESKAFEKSMDLREGAKPFVFYEGPPSANGMPGIHHVISRTLKDLVCRYKTMRGHQVRRKGGWDTHGLPVELGVEKELGISKEDIGKKISVEEYNLKCREAVLRYKDKWDELTRKMGYWVDLEHPYITFENNYIETLWWILKELYNKELLYESVSIQPYSPGAGTGLSSHELNQPGTYKNVKDTSAVAMFKAVRNERSEFLFEAVGKAQGTGNKEQEGKKGRRSSDGAKTEVRGMKQPASDIEHAGAVRHQEALQTSGAEGLLESARPTSNIEHQTSNEVFFLAWTTTPWTLPSNLGLTVGPNIDYVLVSTFNPYTHLPINVVLAKALIEKYFKPEGQNTPLSFKEGDKILPWQISAEFKGAQLEECNYEQLLQYEANSMEAILKETPDAKPFRVLLGDFVTTEDGTGIVHTAPAFGADDFKVGRKYNIGILTMVDREGKFVDGLGEFSNRYVKDYKNEKNFVDVNVDICVKLKKENRAFKVEKYEHTYPHCWRTDKPVLYYPLDAWFIRTTALKDKMVELNKTINWKPKSTGEGRFGNWLENMVDWNLSRSRYWGTPLPIWKSHIARGAQDSELYTVGDADEVCVGSKADLIQCKSKEGIDVKGYYIDLKLLSTDLLSDDSTIIETLTSHNAELKKGFENPGSSVWSKDQRTWEQYLEMHGINILLLQNICKQRQLTVKDIVDARLNLEHLKGYYNELTAESVDQLDLHRPYIDNVCFASSTGLVLYFRVPDLIDVWFDSGAMPYAQWHYPFENKELIDNGTFFPADFIAEGVDQTRGWFYTLHVLGALLFESLAYKTCVSNGLVLDKNGNKMSKRLGNVVDPFKTIADFGADATRWYLITNASPWDNMKFDLEGIREVQRKFFGTLYNTYQFFVLYANVDGFSFKEKYIPLNKRPEIDQWILSALNSLIKKATDFMDDYEPTQAGRAIEEFVDEHLSNWYVRLSRRRFWKGEYEHDKICAYQTLYECLEKVTILMAPVAPFFSDAVFTNLNNVTRRFDAESVHHVDFPVADQSALNSSLEERMSLAQDVSSLVLSLRKKVNIKVRQPLSKVLIPVLNPGMQEQLEKVEDLIRNEVNVKQIAYLRDTEGFIKKKIKPNFVALGKKLGAKMKAVSAALAAFTQEDIARIEKEGSYSLSIADEPVILQLAEVEITSEDVPGWMVANKGPLTVALDITITPDLLNEGNAREFVNRIQKIRKDSGFELTDRIFVKVAETDALKTSIAQFNDYICAEILADKLEVVPQMANGTEIEVNDIVLKVLVTKKA